MNGIPGHAIPRKASSRKNINAVCYEYNGRSWTKRTPWWLIIQEGMQSRAHEQGYTFGIVHEIEELEEYGCPLICTYVGEYTLIHAWSKELGHRHHYMSSPKHLIHTDDLEKIIMTHKRAHERLYEVMSISAYWVTWSGCLMRIDEFTVCDFTQETIYYLKTSKLTDIAFFMALKHQRPIMTVIKLSASKTDNNKENVDVFFFKEPNNYNTMIRVKEMLMRQDFTTSDNLKIRRCESDGMHSIISECSQSCMIGWQLQWNFVPKWR